MIQHTLRPKQPLPTHACGHAPHLVESRGHTLTDPRLLGKPARMYHVECTRCDVATPPVWSTRTAEHLWTTQTGLVPVKQLNPLRLEAERALIHAA